MLNSNKKTFRNSYPEVFLKEGVLKISENSRKTYMVEFTFSKVAEKKVKIAQGLRTCSKFHVLISLRPILNVFNCRIADGNVKSTIWVVNFCKNLVETNFIFPRYCNHLP